MLQMVAPNIFFEATRKRTMMRLVDQAISLVNSWLAMQVAAMLRFALPKIRHLTVTKN